MRAPDASTGLSTTARRTTGRDRSTGWLRHGRMPASSPLPCPPPCLTREIVFSVIQRKVIKPADFADLAALAHRLERFEDRYNRTARPFDWRFTSSDLSAMLERLDTHRPGVEAPLAA